MVYISVYTVEMWCTSIVCVYSVNSVHFNTSSVKVVCSVTYLVNPGCHGDYYLTATRYLTSTSDLTSYRRRENEARVREHHPPYVCFVNASRVVTTGGQFVKKTAFVEWVTYLEKVNIRSPGCWRFTSNVISGQVWLVTVHSWCLYSAGKSGNGHHDPISHSVSFHSMSSPIY